MSINQSIELYKQLDNCTNEMVEDILGFFLQSLEYRNINPKKFFVNFFTINNGFNRHGMNYRTGTEFNIDGYDIEGYDVSGFDKNGYFRDGYDSSGYDVFGYDPNGYDIFGMDVFSNHQTDEINWDNVGSIKRVIGERLKVDFSHVVEKDKYNYQRNLEQSELARRDYEAENEVQKEYQSGENRMNKIMNQRDGEINDYDSRHDEENLW